MLGDFRLRNAIKINFFGDDTHLKPLNNNSKKENIYET